MEALALRLSGLDPYVDGALRIVAFYDTLMRRRVDLPALARASAALAECVTGIRLHTDTTITSTSTPRNSTGPIPTPVTRAHRASPDGTPAPTPAPTATPPTPASSTAPVTLDEEEIGTVWLERPGPPHPLDALLLDRLALATAAAVERYGPARTTMADPALVKLAISPGTDEAARTRALRLLGFAPDRPVQAVAVRTTHPLDRIGGLICPAHPVKAARLPDSRVLLATTVDPTRFPTGVRAGLGAPGSPDRSWRQARTALRFTTPREPVLAHAALGAFALLADLPPEAVRANPDVQALHRLATDPATPDDLAVLDAYCTTGSLRGAAGLLHLHHSSVARRLHQLARPLGFDPTTPTGLTRAHLALTAWRLHDSPEVDH
ncbi:helix-turn-helix domain-containing protein [Streptomyces sp. NPDC097619]|uniref:helix-turn-helix domain-containing protein n=1 Tax=Streptomyces sp. NPDC097619 TaxID=3157228 RepID=UPI00332E4224